MVLLDVTQLTILIVCISVGIILLVVLAVVLNVFVFSKKKIRKQIRDLERKYSYLDALLIGQDSQYIHRLELISRTNLLYVEKHEEFQLRFKEAYENEDKYVNTFIKQLNALVKNNQYKDIKNTIIEAQKAVAAFETLVTDLDHDLYELIKLEEECRTIIYKEKENYRRVKQDAVANNEQLELINNSLNKVFAKLDEYFKQYDTYVEGAEYDEANALLPTIRQVITAVDTSLKQIPDLCVLVNDVIPNKIAEIKDEFDATCKKDIPLHHLMFKQTYNGWNKRLKDLKLQLESLRTNHVANEGHVIEEEIEEMHKAIGREMSDKEDFENRLSTIYNQSIELEKSFIKICALLPEIKRIYLIDNERLNRVEELRDYVNKLTNSRNSLDNYIHNVIRQPYSTLVEKLNELNTNYDNAKTSVIEFKAFVDSLKTYTEEAYNLVFVYYYRCKQIEHMLKNIGIDELTKSYSDKITTCYAFINDIDISVKEHPIDVNSLNQKVESLKSFAHALFEEIEEKYKECQLAESAIVYANRDRQQQSDVNQQLNLIEKSFFDGDFSKVYQDVTTLYKKYHVEEKMHD